MWAGQILVTQSISHSYWQGIHGLEWTSEKVVTGKEQMYIKWKACDKPLTVIKRRLCFSLSVHRAAHSDETGDSASLSLRISKAGIYTTAHRSNVTYRQINYTMWVRNGNRKEMSTRHEKRSEWDLLLWLIIHSSRAASVFSARLTVCFTHYQKLTSWFPWPAAVCFDIDCFWTKRASLGHKQWPVWLKFKQLTHGFDSFLSLQIGSSSHLVPLNVIWSIFERYFLFVL